MNGYQFIDCYNKALQQKINEAKAKGDEDVCDKIGKEVLSKLYERFSFQSLKMRIPYNVDNFLKWSEYKRGDHIKRVSINCYQKEEPKDLVRGIMGARSYHKDLDLINDSLDLIFADAELSYCKK